VKRVSVWRLPGPEHLTEIVLRDSTPVHSRNASMRPAPPQLPTLYVSNYPFPNRTGEFPRIRLSRDTILSYSCNKESRVETLASAANLTIDWDRMPGLKVSAHHTFRRGYVGDTHDTQEFASDSTLP